jgi:glycosyltransferase involved in cell wall biosynthesis
MARLTVIMNCAYGVQYLREAIDSVYAQTFQDWEILFIDNVSDDGSAEVARSYEHTGKMKYVRLETRIPLNAARNVALEMAEGELVSFLDVDDVIEPDAFARQIEKMTPDVNVVYGGWRFIDSQGRALAKYIQGHADGDIVNALLVRSFIAISGILVRRKALESVRFDAGYDLIGDFDMWIRLSAAGNRYAHVEGHLVRIRVHGENMSIVKYRKWIAEERRFYRRFLARHGVFRYPAILAYIVKREIFNLTGHNRTKLTFKLE